MTQVPVIDLEPARAGGPTDRLRVARLIDEACVAIGFFTVTGHGVPDTVSRDLRAAARAFFGMPLATKQRASPTDAGTPRGYHAAGGETLAAANDGVAPADLKEFYHVGPVDVGDDPYYTSARGRQFFLPNIWPADPWEFRAVATTYYRAMHRLVAFLMRLTALGLGLDELYFDDKVNRSIGTMRLNYYPPQHRPPLPGQLRAGAHTDYGGLTILNGEDAPGGLQVRARDGGWTDVRDGAGPVRRQHRRPAHAVDERSLAVEPAPRRQPPAGRRAHRIAAVDRLLQPSELGRDDRVRGAHRPPALPARDGGRLSRPEVRQDRARHHGRLIGTDGLPRRTPVDSHHEERQHLDQEDPAEHLQPLALMTGEDGDDRERHEAYREGQHEPDDQDERQGGDDDHRPLRPDHVGSTLSRMWPSRDDPRQVVLSHNSAGSRRIRITFTSRSARPCRWASGGAAGDERRRRTGRQPRHPSGVAR